MSDTYLLELIGALSALSGVAWGSRFTQLWEGQATEEAVLTVLILVAAYALPLALVLPDSGNPTLEAQKVWVILLLNILVLPGTIIYGPRLVRRLRLRGTSDRGR